MAVTLRQGTTSVSWMQRIAAPLQQAVWFQAVGRPYTFSALVAKKD
jgi:hypothetical protein